LFYVNRFLNISLKIGLAAFWLQEAAARHYTKKWQDVKDEL
jgi:hypothetical protein